MRRDATLHPPRKTAPGAQDAQRAEESKHSEFAISSDAGLPAAYWAIHEALEAAKRAGRCVMCGNPSAGINALNQAARAMSAASDSLQGLMR
jgi:hypothetical protein